MQNQVNHYPEVNFALLPTHSHDLSNGPFVPSMSPDPIFGGDLAYEYLAREATTAPIPIPPNWPAYSPSTYCPYPSFTTTPILMMNVNPPFPPISPLSPLPQEPVALSPNHHQTFDHHSPSSCRYAKPSFDYTQKRWRCSGCGDVFHDKYECERHIGNVGKQAMCLACKKTVCARKDNRKRHYDKYCKRIDLGKHGHIPLERCFVDV